MILNRLVTITYDYHIVVAYGSSISGTAAFSLRKAWIAEVQNGDFVEILGSLPSNTTGQMLVRFTESRCVQL